MWTIIPTLALGLTLTGTVCDSVLTSSVKHDEQGIILGLVNATQSFMRTISPAFGGYAMDRYGFNSLGYIGTILASLAMVGHFIVPIRDIEELKKNDDKVYQNGVHTEAGEEKKEL
uniref:Uncharacterized protein n=1 Tax=Acrobeloides nanus TaxID=290746 RepID=A0A914E2C6_9BILA